MSFKKSETSETIQKGKSENIKSKADNNALKILIDSCLDIIGWMILGT